MMLMLFCSFRLKTTSIAAFQNAFGANLAAEDTRL